MDTEMTALINDQINKEFFSAYLYLDFANYYAHINLDGFKKWYEIQAKEELDHAQIFMQYLQNNDERVVLETIVKPNAVLTTYLQPLKLALEHEKYMTRNIEALYSVALEKKDYRTKQLLDWYIKEQGEEEKTAGDMIAKAELFGSDPKGLYMLNTEFLSRVYTAPSLMI